MLGNVKISFYPLVFCCLFGCLGCRRQAREIYVIPRDTAEALWVTEHVGTAQASKQLGLQLYWNGPNGDDEIETQLALIERAIRGRAFGLVVSPSSPFALRTAIERALRGGIPVAIVGPSIPIEPTPGLFQVEPDNESLGNMVVARLGTSDEQVAIAGTDSLLPGSIQRSTAVENAIRTTGRPIHVVRRLNRRVAFGQMELAIEQMIKDVPHLSAIIAVNIGATRAAVAAIRAAHAQGRIRIIGCDQTTDLLYLVRSGEVDSIAIQDMRSMGAIAVHDLWAARHGQPAPAVSHVPMFLVTMENINADHTQSLLSMDWTGAE